MHLQAALAATSLAPPGQPRVGSEPRVNRAPNAARIAGLNQNNEGRDHEIASQGGAQNIDAHGRDRRYPICRRQGCSDPQAGSKNYPSRPVRLIIDNSPGAPSDIFCGVIGNILSQSLGEPFVVENRPGGGSTIAGRACVSAPPDGYTLCMVCKLSLRGRAGAGGMTGADRLCGLRSRVILAKTGTQSGFSAGDFIV
jgi:hypothetical protein